MLVRLVCAAGTAAALGFCAHAGTPAFTDQTLSTQVDASYSALGGMHSFLGGGAVGDFNNDGFQDIFYPAGGGVADMLFINNGNGTFDEEGPAWGVAVENRSTAAVAGDYNNDGWLDIFVTSLGPVGGNAPGHHRLYRNNGDNTFTNVAADAGVAFASPTVGDGWGGAWGDYDLDGDLDLVVTGWISGDSNRLFRNDGDGTFTDVTVSAGLTGADTIVGFAPRFVDMDDDRFPELIWIGDFSTSRYYVNDGDGTFTDMTAGSGTSLDGTEMGMTVTDIDEDGDFDFYVTTINTNNLYRNNGNHSFTNIANQTGVSNTAWGWGTVAVDFDHDTYFDLIATTQSGRQYAFRNNLGDGTLQFSEVANTIGLVSNASGRGLANLDYDNDGDQDVIIFPRTGSVRVFRNDLSGDDVNWLRVFLDNNGAEDIAPNGVGSVIRVTFDDRTLTGRIDAGSNYLSNSELSAHFGLGTTAVIDTLRVEWTNGEVTELQNVPANQTITVTAATTLLGDLNCDGAVSVGDINAFVLALTDPNGYTDAFPDCDILNADCSKDGAVTVGDINCFVSLVTGG